MSKNQIFYDKRNIRWKYSKRTLLIIAAFLIATFAVSLLSIIIQEPLPSLTISEDNDLRQAAMPPTNNKQQTYQPISPNLQKPKKKAESEPKIMAYFVNWDDNSFTSLKENINYIDVLMPEWLYVKDGSGEIIRNDPDRQKEVLEYIEKNRSDLPVHVLINNYNEESQKWDGETLLEMLSSVSSRTTTINQTIEFAKKYNLEGISVDFENIDGRHVKNLEFFMKELSEKAHAQGLQISQNLPLESSLNIQALERYSDFLIFMSYDASVIQHTLAGPIAPQGWYEKNVAQIFSQIPLEKVVLAIGGYGYDWVDNSTEGRDVTFQDVMLHAKKSQSEVSSDKSSLNPTFDYYQDNQLHHVWFLDAVTAYNQMIFADNYGGPKGYALWRLGGEDPSIWNIFEAMNKNNEEQLKSALEKIAYDNTILFDGSGEVLQVIEKPSDGKRKIEMDQKSGLVVSETYENFPSSYVVSRWGAADKKKIALTFDDGPDRGYTPKVLDILKEQKAPASFFVIGMNASVNSDILKRIESEGHEIGNHTYTHPNIASITKEEFALELDASERLFEGLLKKKSLLFRPPYAQDVQPEKPEEVKPLLVTNQLGYYTVGMNIDPRDWEMPGKEEIVRRTIEDAKSGKGNVVLLHDSGGNRTQTLEALPEIIEGLRKEGFELVTISDLLNVPHASIMPDVNGEVFVNGFNKFSFLIINYFLEFMRIIFFAGIFLGSFRFVFLAVLALAQAIHSRKAAYRKENNHNHLSVSVIIPAYNEEKVIVATVKSILASEYKALEIIVVDDGSTDTTHYRLQDSFSHNKKVKILRQKNKGKAAALNHGISHCQSEIVITLDADTLFLPNTIEKLIRGFQDRRIAAIAGNAKVGNRLNILTKWQALEYIVSQNLDRRAFEFINCIPVVPGSVGAWRRKVILKAGGFSSDTLAEDSDLTFSILRQGHHISYEEEAIAFTEAPDSIKSFIKQRFRWMYGMLQTTWKHKSVLFKRENLGLGYLTLPNIMVFQIFFTLVSPLMDLMLILSLFWFGWQRYHHQVDFTVSHTFTQMVSFYLFFLVIDLFSAAVPFSLEKKEQWNLLIWLPLQRFFYRQLMYYVAIKTMLTALKGTIVGWGKFERKASVLKN